MAPTEEGEFSHPGTLCKIPIVSDGETHWINLYCNCNVWLFQSPHPACLSQREQIQNLRDRNPRRRTRPVSSLWLREASHARKMAHRILQDAGAFLQELPYHLRDTHIHTWLEVGAQTISMEDRIPFQMIPVGHHPHEVWRRHAFRLFPSTSNQPYRYLDGTFRKSFWFWGFLQQNVELLAWCFALNLQGHEAQSFGTVPYVYWQQW